jgi:hypothetical protein
MTKLKLETIEDDKSVNRMVKFPGAVYRDLAAYAEVLARDGGNATAPDPIKLVVPMLQRFMVTDKAFQKARAQFRQTLPEGAPTLALRLTYFRRHDDGANTGMTIASGRALSDSIAGQSSFERERLCSVLAGNRGAFPRLSRVGILRVGPGRSQ